MQKCYFSVDLFVVPVLKSVVFVEIFRQYVLCEQHWVYVFYAALAAAFFVPLVHAGRLFLAVLGFHLFFPTCLRSSSSLSRVLAGLVALIYKFLYVITLHIVDDTLGEGSTANREVCMFLQSREV